MGRDWNAIINEGVHTGLEAFGIIVEGHMVLLAPIDEGRLRSSIGYSVKGKPSLKKDGVDTPGHDYTLHVGTSVEYAMIMEHGGWVTAKNAKFLAIPLKKELKGRSPRDLPNLSVLRSKAGSLLLGTWRGEEFEPMFALKKRVYVPAHPYARPAYEKNKHRATETVSAGITAALKKHRRHA